MRGVLHFLFKLITHCSLLTAQRHEFRPSVVAMAERMLITVWIIIFQVSLFFIVFCFYTLKFSFRFNVVGTQRAASARVRGVPSARVGGVGCTPDAARRRPYICSQCVLLIAHYPASSPLSSSSPPVVLPPEVPLPPLLGLEGSLSGSSPLSTLPSSSLVTCLMTLPLRS